jgi:hypothetical protein
MVTERVLPARAAAPALEAAFGIASPWRILGEEHFSLTVTASVDVDLQFRGRIQRPDGTIEKFNHQVNVLGTRVQQVFRLPVEAGQLLHARLLTATDVKVGQCFCRLLLAEGNTSGAALAVGTIIQGYVANGNDLGWPGSPIMQSTDGPGVLQMIDLGGAVPGQALTTTVPVNTRWHLLCASVVLTCSAAAGNRTTVFRLDNAAGQQVFAVFSNLVLAALQANAHQFVHGMAYTPPASMTQGHGPLLTHRGLPAGFRINFAVNGMDVADQLTIGVLLVEEWIEPAP